VGINAVTAKRKGIADGDTVEIETPDGFTERVTVRVTQGVHPECLAMPGILGRKVAGNRGQIGKGGHFNSLLRNSAQRLDTVSCAYDACAKVKVRTVAAA